MHEIVQQPPRESIEGNTAEILECLRADPESTPVVAEEVFSYRYVVGGRLTGMFAHSMEIELSHGPLKDCGVADEGILSVS